MDEKDIQFALADARKMLVAADHMLTITYPMINDPKMLLSITNNAFSAISNGMNALLGYEHQWKRVSSVPQEFMTQLTVFKNKVAKNVGFPNETIKKISEVLEIVNKHKTSPVEFVRKNKFVICSDTYGMNALTVERTKSFIKTAKYFVEKVDEWVNKNGD